MTVSVHVGKQFPLYTAMVGNRVAYNLCSLKVRVKF